MEETLFPYIAEDGLMGFKNFEGNIVIPAQWDEVKHFGYTAGFLSSVPGADTGVARVRRGSKWGLIDKTGACVLPCEYDEIEYNKWGGRVYILLRLGPTYGVADLSGKVLLPPCKLSPGSVMVIGDFIFHTEQLRGPDLLFNVRTGRYLPDKPYIIDEELCRYGLIPFSSDKQHYGIIDGDGNEILPEGFLPGGFSKALRQGAFVRFISADGPEYLLDLDTHEFFACDDFWNGVLSDANMCLLTSLGWRPVKEAGEIRFQDKQGNALPLARTADLDLFSEEALKLILRSGRLPQSAEGKAGVCDKNLKVALEAKYDRIDCPERRNLVLYYDGYREDTTRPAEYWPVLRCQAGASRDFIAIDKEQMHRFPSGPDKGNGFFVYKELLYCSDGHSLGHYDEDNETWLFFPEHKYGKVEYLRHIYESGAGWGGNSRELRYGTRTPGLFCCECVDSSAVDFLDRAGHFVCRIPVSEESGRDFQIIGDGVIVQGTEVSVNFTAHKYFNLQGEELPESVLSGYKNEVMADGGCQLKDLAGNDLSDSFDKISSFCFDRAYVKSKSRMGVIDIDGKVVVPLTSKLSGITTFKSGYAECTVKTKDGGVKGIIDLWGNVKALSGDGEVIKITPAKSAPRVSKSAPVDIPEVADPVLDPLLEDLARWNKFAKEEILRECKAVFVAPGSGLSFILEEYEYELMPMAGDDPFHADFVKGLSIRDDGHLQAEGPCTDIDMESESFECNDWLLFLWNVRNALPVKDAYSKPEDYQRYESVKDSLMDAEKDAALKKRMEERWDDDCRIRDEIISEFTNAIEGTKRVRLPFDDSRKPYPLAFKPDFSCDQVLLFPITDLHKKGDHVYCSAFRLERYGCSSCNNWPLLQWHLRQSIQKNLSKKK